MTDQALHDLIFADATAKAMADAGNDAGAATRAAAIAPKEPFSFHVTEKGVFAAFANPVDGETVLQKLESAGQSNAVVKRALGWLKPSETGLDIGHPSTRAMIDTLVTATVLTQTEANTIKALAERSPAITADDVSRVWAQYRPNGQVGG